VVCRELTKTYEQIVRGGLGELAAWAADGVRGEVTVVIAGAVIDASSDLAASVERVKTLVNDGVRLKQAVADVSSATGVRKNALYEAVLEDR
jgi:16S rRNA (cytidine1402-2'-O)-methyltransferase